MNGKTRSILLQVAFKEAAARGEDVAATKLLTSQFYVLLTELHDEIGINADEGGFTRASGGAPRASKPRMATPDSAVPFTTEDGTQWLDYRAAKVANEVKSNFPDFKTKDGQKSVWAYTRDGEPVSEAAELTAAADGIASLTAPM